MSEMEFMIINSKYRHVLLLGLNKPLVSMMNMVYSYVEQCKAVRETTLYIVCQRNLKATRSPQDPWTVTVKFRLECKE
jgi:hypothetical protein